MGPGDIGERLARPLAALLVVSAMSVTPASGHELTVYSCHDPAGNAVGHDGWVNQRTADLDMYALDSCAARSQGSMSLELAANGAGYPNAARTEWVFTAPPWGSILAYRVSVAGSYAMPWAGAGEGQTFISASDESDPNYDYRNLAAGSLGAQTITRTPPAPDSTLSINASCDGQAGPCPAGPRVASIDVPATEVTLSDPTSPTITSVAGALQPGASLSGEADVVLNASDSGPGVYSATLTVDGTVRSSQILNENDGWCRDLGQTSDGTRAFAHPDPCPQSASGSLALNTAKLADGTHTIELTVDDASGNTTIAYDGTITTHNAPTNGAEPDPPQPTANGSHASESAHLTLTGRAALTRGYRASPLTLHGALSDSDGTPIAGATLEVSEHTADGSTRTLGQARTQSDGTFTAPVPAGPSRRLVIAYRAYSSDGRDSTSAQLRETVRTAVSLTVTPRRTSREGTITLKGRVAGPIPRAGVIVELLVHYRGQWEPFRTPRTDAHGRFRVSYRFQGALGSFPFRARVLGEQAGFPYAQGQSAAVTVRTT